MAVFAVHRVKEQDVSQALTYGELNYINGRYVFPDEIEGTKLPSKFQQNLERAVDRFDPDHDFMLIAGDHLQLVTFAGMLAVRWGSFKVLRFDREAGGYYPVTVDVGNGHPEL